AYARGRAPDRTRDRARRRRVDRRDAGSPPPTRGQHRARRVPRAESRQGRGHSHRARASDGRSRAHPGRRPRVRPRGLAKLLTPILRGKAEVVYGSRFTGERRNMLYLHWVGNRFLSLVTNVLHNTTLSDMETCYKLFDRSVLQGIPLRAMRFEFEPEVTAKILRRGIRIYEVPISYTGREFDEGKKITWRDGFVALWTLVKYRF